MASFQCCGDPQLPASTQEQIDDQRQLFLQQNGQQSAAAFDAIYGYGALNNCGRYVSYFAQRERANGEHCRLPHYASRRAQVDQYRGLHCRRLRGWDTRMQRVDAPSCCTSPGSCNGTLPYPYAQAQIGHCDPDFARYATPSSCSGAQRPQFLYALNEPYRYPTPPYPQAYHMNAWPYGERAPTPLDIKQRARCRCKNQ